MDPERCLDPCWECSPRNSLRHILPLVLQECFLGVSPSGFVQFFCHSHGAQGIINRNLGYFLTNVFQLEILGEKGNQRDAQGFFRVNSSLQAKGGIHWQKERTIPSQPSLLPSGLLFHLE